MYAVEEYKVSEEELTNLLKSLLKLNTENEWIEFQQILRFVLIGMDMKLELFDDENDNNEYASIVSSISPISAGNQIQQLIKLF